jgi:uncharacterized protein
MAIRIEHDEKGQLFYFEEEGDKGELKYYLTDRAMDLVHTYVPSTLRGEGYGDALMQAAVNYAKDQDYSIIPSCPFAEAYCERHPSAKELIAP